MPIITKNIRWRALMETYQTAKFDRSISEQPVLRYRVNGLVAGTKKKKKKE